MQRAIVWLRRIATGLGVLVVMLGLMQLVPYGQTHTNPPVVQEPNWDHPRTRELAARACFDCHSNETKWPWYAKVAPFSWVMQRDVDAGRSTFNFSEWSRPSDLVSATGTVVLGREMPPRSYSLLHGHARLTADERLELARGLHATFGLAWRE
jgi:hypothetical protein